ncbi:MAG: hypothetical protein ISS36_03470 [Candidatus Aenigmarchaeota archaeon]|nr:hypothetical protein [Candidatus Aenigmarchaeota archaeon]
MKIIICSSIDFTYEIDKASKKLKEKGHDVHIPFTANRILNGELTLEEYKNEKRECGDEAFRKVQSDPIKRYYKTIGESDIVLVINVEKKGIKGYIGGNTLLEMGFAHVLGKKIFLLNDIPDMSYTDEIKAMQPIVLNGDLSKIGEL